MSTPSSPDIAIVGGGIVGASIAYYLAQKQLRAIVFEATGIASSSSGKAAGFLASDWCSKPLDSLARYSFQLHSELAEQFDPELIEYRKVEAYSIDFSDNKNSSNSNRWTSNSNRLCWLDAKLQPVTKPSQIGSMSTCAQVTPSKLTHALFKKAKTVADTQVRIAHVTNVYRDSTTNKWKIEFKNENKENEYYIADIVVLCMGAWTTKACTWFPSLAPIIAHKAASLIVHTGETNDDKNEISPTMLFTQYTDRRGQLREPEAYPRPHGDVYVCQSAVPDDLPRTSAEVTIDERDETDLKIFASGLNSSLAQQMSQSDSKTQAAEQHDMNRSHRFYTSQACYLPISSDSIPMIGAIPGEDNVYVAAGHSCWGILNAPATGKALVDLIVDGKSEHVDLSPFDPKRFS